MGADRFVAIYGVKTELSDDETEAFESRWKVEARRVKLITWSGRLTDGGPYYVVVGALIADLGIEGRDTQVTLSDAAHADLVLSTRAKLKLAGAPGEPALHFLFEAQY